MPEVVVSSEAFPVEMTDEEMTRTWHLDDMHMPFALTPLACDQIDLVLGQSFDHSYELFGGAMRNVGRTWNGRAYFGWADNVPLDEVKAANARWTEICRERIPATHAFWNDEAMPELRRIYAQMEAIDVDGLDGAGLAAAWLVAWAGMLRAWQLHFIIILGPYQVLEDLSDAYAAAIGPGRDVEALTLVGGHEHELEDVEARLDHLIDMLAASPALLAAVRTQASELDGLRDEPAPDEGRIDRDALRAVPGGSEFVDALDAFLVEHGHLGQTHDDLRYASFGAEPRLVLATIVTRLAGRSRGPGRTERLAAARQLAADRADSVRAALADKPDDLARFEATLAHAIEIGHLTEGHNYWIDRMSQARMRALAMRVGDRLVRDGVLERRSDVFFLRRDDVADALVDGAGRQELVGARRAEHEVNRARVAPPFLGIVPEAADVDNRFSTARVEPTTPDELRGMGASAGIVRGRARVVLSQDEFGRVQPGEIVVCPASNPSWVPVFTIAGGLVTNTGGVLSHAAVVAREFGLPAVTGVAEATSKIRTGRLVEIDGTSGTVRLL